MKKTKITKRNRDLALDEAELAESRMTRIEIQLRDRINKELSRRGFHLRVMNLRINSHENAPYTFDFVPPINDWIDEDPKVVSIVIQRIEEWLDKPSKSE